MAFSGLLLGAEGRGSCLVPYLTDSPGVSGVRAAGGMVRTPADNAISLDSSQPSGPGAPLISQCSETCSGQM
jgi:hypothetical protein